MKRIILVLLMGPLVLQSCQNEREKLVKDYEEQNGDTITDLHLIVENLEFIGTITGLDSANILIINNFNKRMPIDSVVRLLNNRNNEIDWVLQEFEYTDVDKFWHWSMNEKLYNINLRDKVVFYSELGDKVLANKWDCVYTIKNPNINNAKQRINKRYAFSPDNKYIITRVD